jgi:hypothetical protein
MKIKTGLWMKIPQLLRLLMLAAAIEQQKERKKIDADVPNGLG